MIYDSPSAALRYLTCTICRSPVLAVPETGNTETSTSLACLADWIGLTGVDRL